MVEFGKPASGAAAGTYTKLLVRTAKYVKALSRYPAEEEYLIRFNTAFKVTLHSHMMAKQIASRSFAGHDGASTQPSNVARRPCRAVAAEKSRFHRSAGNLT